MEPDDIESNDKSTFNKIAQGFFGLLGLVIAIIVMFFALPISISIATFITALIPVSGLLLFLASILVYGICVFSIPLFATSIILGIFIGIISMITGHDFEF